MSTVPYERHLNPPMIKSPFLRGITGAGFIGEPKFKPVGEDEEDAEDPARRVTRTIERPRRANPTPPQTHVPLPLVANGYHDPRSAVPGPSRPPAQPAQVATPTPSYRNPQQPSAPAQRSSSASQANRTIAAMMGGPQMMEQIAVREMLPQETSESISHCFSYTLG